MFDWDHCGSREGLLIISQDDGCFGAMLAVAFPVPAVGRSRAPGQMEWSRWKEKDEVSKDREDGGVTYRWVTNKRINDSIPLLPLMVVP